MRNTHRTMEVSPCACIQHSARPDSRTSRRQARVSKAPDTQSIPVSRCTLLASFVFNEVGFESVESFAGNPVCDGVRDPTTPTPMEHHHLAIPQCQCLALLLKLELAKSIPKLVAIMPRFISTAFRVNSVQMPEIRAKMNTPPVWMTIPFDGLPPIIQHPREQTRRGRRGWRCGLSRV
jgi:hypothetical protein